MNKINKPISACACCNLKYTRGTVLSGFSIVCENKQDSETYSIIDIPGEELKNLRNLIDNILNETKN